MEPITWTEIITIGSIVLGGGGAVALKKKGFVITRKKPCPLPTPVECPDPACQSKVEQTAEVVKEIRTDQRETIFPAIKELSVLTARIDERTALMAKK